MQHSRLGKRARVLAGVLGLVAVTAVTASAASTPVYRAPQAYYLALGDSMAYGFQPTKAGKPPSGYRTGYVDVFSARMRRLAPGIRVVNFGCPGESTETFIAGGCPGRGPGVLHNDFKGAQLEAAVAFLRAHSGKVSPITVTLWGNDVFEDFAPACKGDIVCIRAHSSGGLVRFGSRLDLIMSRLRSAAPTAEIILTGAWNLDVEHGVKTDPLFRSVDQAIARAAAGAGARVAKMYSVFSPPGKQKARICALTFICTNGDPHPTDAGYRAMADAFMAASGYPR